MTTSENKNIEVTLRQCIHFSNAIDKLMARGSFAFRCAIGSTLIEAKTIAEQFSERQKPARGILDYQKELSLIEENCTEETDGKKSVNIALYMPLFKKAQGHHAKAIEAAEQLQKDANKALDELISIKSKPIPMKLLEEADNEEKFETSLLSCILPFCVVTD